MSGGRERKPEQDQAGGSAGDSESAQDPRALMMMRRRREQQRKAESADDSAAQARTAKGMLSDAKVVAVIEHRIHERKALAALKSVAKKEGASAEPPAEVKSQIRTLSSEQLIELCKRPADIPGLNQLGVSHWWVRTQHFERGMGPATGAVPGEASSSDAPGSATSINDHSGRGEREGSTCEPVAVEDVRWEHEDEECLNAVMKLNSSSGRWMPWNQCHSIVNDALDACRIPQLPGAEVPSGGVDSTPNDGGTEGPSDGGVQ